MKPKTLYTLLIFALIYLVKANDEIIIETKAKQYNGLSKIIDGKEINYFLGIPYAEPPLGSLRFRKPKPYQYSSSINATKWGSVCYQTGILNNKIYLSNKSEDCLYLNIWSPKKEKELRPVMFWIHGGALMYGSASDELYDGQTLAAKGDVIVVTINYRLNAFGFLYTGTDDAPGNVGFLDQVMALEWVKGHIESFGGDPNRITIFGESAGSWSVGLHILSPLSRNLFQNAIMMSGGPLIRLTGISTETAKQEWLKVAKLANCGDGTRFTPEIINCLRNVSAEILTKIVDRTDLTTDLTGFMPLVIYGDEFMPKMPEYMLSNGDFKKNVNLMFGFTDDEGSWLMTNGIDPIKYSPLNPKNITKAQAYEDLMNFSRKMVTNYSPVRGEEVSKLYLSRIPPNDTDLIRRTLGVAIGDIYISCATMLFANMVYNNDRTHNKIFQYYFTAKIKTGFSGQNCGPWQGACHTQDIFPAFGYVLREPTQFSGELKKVSEKMFETFTQFAKNGHPPAQESIDWSEYYSKNNDVIRPYYEFSETLKTEGNFGHGLKIDECDKLWAHYITGLKINSSFSLKSNNLLIFIFISFFKFMFGI